MGIDMSEEAMPIELRDPLTGKYNFLQIFKSTHFSDAPETGHQNMNQ